MSSSEQLVISRTRNDLIGVTVPRIDTSLKVSGGVTYTRDMTLPRMLVGMIKRSPYPHAKILKIDASRAARLPGVRTVITGHDFSPEGTGVDTPPLAFEEVLYAGQGVAAVAAEDRRTAELALEEIVVEYQELPVMLDAEEAISSDPPTVIKHPGERCEVPNVGRHLKIRRGDVESGFARSARIVENTYTTAIESHFPLEPMTYLARPDNDGGLTLWVTSTGPHKAQLELAKYLRMNPYLIRVTVGFLGGWFGSKEESHVGAVCAKLALKSGRPVKLQLSREENMTTLGVRHPTKIRVKDGVSDDGKILARQVTAIYDGGAYGSLGNSILKNSALSVAAVYNIPNVRLDSYRVYTNRVPGTPKPGTMGPQMFWAIECQMDRIADLLRIDPLELRMRNILKNGDENAIGERMHSICYDKALAEAARGVGWGSPAQRGDGKWRWGRGIAVATKWASGGIGQAMVRLRENGVVEVWVDVVENGQGIYTGISQIPATEFGIPISKVLLLPFVEGSKSEASGLADGASSSRQMVYMGNAILLACRDAKEKVAQHASKVLGIPAGRLSISGGKVFATDDPARSLDVSELFATTHIYSGTGAYTRGTEFVGYGTFFKEVGKFDPETGQCIGPPISPYYVAVAQGAEVSVNVETGRVKVHKIVAAMDIGKAVNPGLVKAQTVNAVAMGMSAALSEELVLANGRIANPNLADYKLLSVVDAPNIIPVLLEVPYDEGPYGAKGAGNPSILPTAAAIRNAIHDATGAWVNDVPMTPERVLEALTNAKQ